VVNVVNHGANADWDCRRVPRKIKLRLRQAVQMPTKSIKSNELGDKHTLGELVKPHQKSHSGWDLCVYAEHRYVA
jgi:hypothetical protein